MADIETRAFRNKIAGALIAFAVGFIVSIVLLWNALIAGKAWWEIPMNFLQMIFWATMGGLVCTWPAMYVADWWYHMREAYRCPYCDEPYKRMGDVCACDEAAAHRAEYRKAEPPSEKGT